jgi:hypothetical protein
MNVLNEEVYDDYEPQWDGSKLSLAAPSHHVKMYLDAFESGREQFPDTANISVSSSVPGLYAVLVTGLSAAQLMFYCATVYAELPPDALEPAQEATGEPESLAEPVPVLDDQEADDEAAEEPLEAEEDAPAPTAALAPRQVVIQRRNRPVVVKTGNPAVTIEESPAE